MNINPADLINPQRRRPRNKFMAGCLIVFVVLGLLLSLGAWWFVGRPVNQAFQSIQDLQSAPALETRLDNRASFSAPADRELERSQVERFISVQQSIRDQLEGDFTTLAERYEQVGNQQLTLTGALGMAGAYRDYIGLLGDARDAQVAALNAQGFSAGEYQWVRTEVLRAAGLPGGASGFEGLVGALSGQAGAGTPQTSSTQPAPAANVELVQEMSEEMRDITGLAILGF